MVGTKTSLFKLILIFFMALVFAACDSDDNGNHVSEMDIVDTAVDNGNFTTLVAAVQAAGLEETLRGPGPFTLFAPTDDAFDALPDGTVDFLLMPENKDTLVDILTYHVYSGSVLAADVIALDGESVNMVNGGSVSIDVVGGNVILNQGGNRAATVTTTDVVASNGVIHVIDTVLDPGDSMQ